MAGIKPRSLASTAARPGVENHPLQATFDERVDAASSPRAESCSIRKEFRLAKDLLPGKSRALRVSGCRSCLQLVKRVGRIECAVCSAFCTPFNHAHRNAFRRSMHAQLTALVLNLAVEKVVDRNNYEKKKRLSA